MSSLHHLTPDDFDTPEEYQDWLEREPLEFEPSESTISESTISEASIEPPDKEPALPFMYKSADLEQYKEAMIKP